MVSSLNLALSQCAQCGHADEAGAKFCGGCGISNFNAGRNTGLGQLPQQIYVAPPTFPNPTGIQYAQATPIAPAPTQMQAQQPFPSFTTQGAPVAPNYGNQQTATGGYNVPVVQQIPSAYAAPSVQPAAPIPATQPAHNYVSAYYAPVQTAPSYAQVPPAPTVVLPELPRSVPPGMGRALTEKAVPSFAQFHAANPPAVNKELQAEAAKLIVLLARERLFLVFHIGLFLTMNAIGLMLSNKCYSEFLGDEVSKIVMAMTPFIFINLVALVCIVPIKGTRKEIARLKERISYVRFKLEFGHLM